MAIHLSSLQFSAEKFGGIQIMLIFSTKLFFSLQTSKLLCFSGYLFTTMRCIQVIRNQSAPRIFLEPNDFWKTRMWLILMTQARLHTWFTMRKEPVPHVKTGPIIVSCKEDEMTKRDRDLWQESCITSFTWEDNAADFYVQFWQSAYLTDYSAMSFEVMLCSL